MRPIKFRAWDVESPAMMEWEEIKDMWESEGFTDSIFRNDHWVCMQYTGLKDKNGKEIYEGDIVSYASGGTKQANPIAIEWDLTGWQPWLDGCGDSYYAVSNVEVIGNIYENPELLNEQKP